MLLKIVILLMEKLSHMDKNFNRDMLMKIVILWKKLVAHGHISWIWFDRRTMREEMTIFKKKKQHMEGYKRFFMGAMFMKIIILLKENWSHLAKFLYQNIILWW
jgi:hypothetical protein